MAPSKNVFRIYFSATAGTALRTTDVSAVRMDIAYGVLLFHDEQDKLQIAYGPGTWDSVVPMKMA